MSRVFLKVNKDLFKSGLNPTEILVLSQVAEFNTNTGDCFISDKQLAEQFGVSDKTISRAIKHLEELGYIKRETKNIKGGKERHIKIVNSTTDKMSIDKGQNVYCTTDKMSVDNGQNVFIKDNIEEDNTKENIKSELSPLAAAQSQPKATELVKVSKAQMLTLWKPEDITYLEDNIILVGNKKFAVEV